ncbi:MAG TPA: transposase [Pseudonocardiaceae bacterium]|nr:transposase [Pseudonocardiaceae bacterium]
MAWRTLENIKIKPLVSCSILAEHSRCSESIGVHEITLGKWVTKAQGDESGRDKELSETERAELERLRKENAVLLWSMVGENGPVVVVRADAHEPNSGAWADRFFLAEVFCAPIELD